MMLGPMRSNLSFAIANKVAKPKKAIKKVETAMMQAKNVFQKATVSSVGWLKVVPGRTPQSSHTGDEGAQMKGTTIQISLRDARALLAEARGEGNPVTYMAAVQRLRERAAYAERREERRKKERQK